METISTVFLRQVMKYQTRPALMVKKEGTYQPLSWQDWYEQVASFGLGLHDLEIGPGDAVAILCNNRPEWMTADLAILGLGAMTIPIYATNTADQAAFILQDARCKAVIVENPDQWQKIALVKNRLTDLNTVIQMDGLPHSTSNRLAFFDVLAKGLGLLKTDPGLFPRLSSQALPEDICTIVYTSGTTGPPKGAMLSHDNILSVIRMLGRVVPATDRDSYVSFLPLSHVFERIGGFFNGIYVGVTIFLAESMDTLARNIQEAKPTILMTVPRLLEKVYATIQNRVKEESSTKQAIFNWSQKIGREKGRRQMLNQAVPFSLRWKHALAYQLVFRKLKQALGGRIRFLVSAGAPISQEIVEFFSAAGLYVMEGYGATETSAPVSVNVLDDYRFGTVGKPLPGVEIRIDPLNGEILVKGGNIFKGYTNLPGGNGPVLHRRRVFPHRRCRAPG